MLFSSLMTCTGQLCWKLSADYSIRVLPAGGVMYGLGALLMIVALRYGDLSKLHPLLSAGYILSVALGAAILDEPVTVHKVVGIMGIITGLILINLPEREKE